MLEGDAVDGSEIRRSPVEVGSYPSIHRVLYISGGAGFLPSTVVLKVVISSSELNYFCYTNISIDGKSMKAEVRPVGRKFQSSHVLQCVIK